MFSNSSARKSVDSLSPTISAGSRGDFPFHGKRSHSPQRTHQRRSSTASSIYSVGGSLESSNTFSAGPVLEIGQNAISTLLQPPIVRTGLLPHTSAPASSTHKPPTARDIPPVTLTNIPVVDSSEFTSYLTQVGALYEQLRRIQTEDDESSSLFNRKGSRHDDVSEGLDESHLRPGKRPGASRRTSTASISSLSSIEAPSPVRRSSSGFRRGAAHGPPPLSTIPTVYFDEDFHLENPRTFDVVSERSEVVRPAPGTEDKAASNGNAGAPRKALATNAILQEKLSWYMDTIEMHLIQSISTASTTFFTALGSLRELHSEAADSVDRIKALRKELETLDNEVAKGGLEIVQQRRRKENLQQLHEAVMQLREIVDGVAVCESLVDAGEVDAALDNIDALENLISGEASAATSVPRLRDLRGATALQGVSDDLDTLRLRIGKAYETRFLNVLLGDLRRHIEQVSSQEVLMRWSNASMRGRGPHNREPSAFPSYMSSVDGLRTELLTSLTGLQRANYLAAATATFRDAVLRDIKNIIRQPLPSSNEDDNESMMSSSTMTGGRQRSQQEKSSVLARNLRALDPKDAEELLVKIYIGVTEMLRRLSTQVKVLLDVASRIGDPSGEAGLKSPPIKSPPHSPMARHPSAAGLAAQEEIHKALDISNLLGQAVDAAQDKIVKVLRVRTEQSTHLDLSWFLRYFTLNLHFANECEAISGRGGTMLKTIVNSQIKDFIQYHGDSEKQRLAQGMESDQWNAVDFGDRETELLNRILEGSTRDASVWSEGTKIWIPHPDADDEQQLEEEEPSQPNGAGKARTRSAVIDEETFMLPNSAVLCMNGMAKFLHLIVSIPSLSAEISASLVAYLQLFNSRCTQLILGAGATRSAGLKNITTKHLALASQALAFIAAIIPHVRELVRRHCGSGATVSNVMGEFDRVRRLYQEHQNSIYDKLVEIMTGRALVASRKLKSVDWESADASPHEYMEMLAKETLTLHRNLVKNLPEGAVRMIMFAVFKNYKDTFGSAFRGLEVASEAARVSMLGDIHHFQTRLSKIDGFEDAGDYLSSVITGKEVKGAAPPASTSPAPPVSTTPAPAPTSAPTPAPTQAPTSSTPPPEPTPATPAPATNEASKEPISEYLQAQAAGPPTSAK